MENKLIGNDGYSPKGLDGLPGDSGQRTHFSAYDLENDLEIVKELVEQSKALSNNPAFQTYEEYEVGDAILDYYGEIFTITQLSPSLSVIKIADFFPNEEEYIDKFGDFEMYMRPNGKEGRHFNYNKINFSDDDSKRVNSCPLMRLQKNINASYYNDYGAIVYFKGDTLAKIKELLSKSSPSPVKLSFIFKCGLTKEVIFNSESEVTTEIFIENEYIDMCGYMTNSGSRETVKLNNSYLKNSLDASIYYTEMKKISEIVSYPSVNSEIRNNGATNYCAPLIFGYNFDDDVPTPSPEKAMCDAFIEYYVKGKMFSKKIKLVAAS